MKTMTVLAFAAVLMLPVSVQAADYGVYVAPKIAMSVQNLHVKVSVDGAGSEAVKGSKTVIGGGVAVGYDLMPQHDVPLRVEAEVTTWGNASTTKTWSAGNNTMSLKGQTEIMPVFLNVYYDFHNESAFTPYVGLGLGFANVKSKAKISASLPDVNIGDSITKTSNSTNFAWNVGLGCAYSFNDMFSVDLGYRYANYGSTKSHSGVHEGVSYHFRSQNNSQHQLLLGGRVTF